MDPVTLIVTALASGTSAGVLNTLTDDAREAVKSAYRRLHNLAKTRLVGHPDGEISLERYENAPQKWKAMLASELAEAGAAHDAELVEAAQTVMQIVDAVGAGAGKYSVSVGDSRAVQVGDGNQQFNIYSTAHAEPRTSPGPRFHPGESGNEAAFGPVYDEAGGKSILGEAVGAAREEGPGVVQYFKGGPGRGPAVICALYSQVPVAVSQNIWNEIRAVGKGTYAGVAALGYPVRALATENSFISSQADEVELDGGEWGRGKLVLADDRWRWRPEIIFDSKAYQYRSTRPARTGEMDLRLRCVLNVPTAEDGLRISEPGRKKVIDALPSTGMVAMVQTLASRYHLQVPTLEWRETPGPMGSNDTLRAAYDLAVPGPDGRTALQAAVSLSLPTGAWGGVLAIADFEIDFDAVRPGASSGENPVRIAPELKVSVPELAGFYGSAWQTVQLMPTAAISDVRELCPAGAPRLELYVDNDRHGNSGAARTMRILDMIDMTPFGRTRKPDIDYCSVGITVPVGLAGDEIDRVVRKAIIRMAEDAGFTETESVQIGLLPGYQRFRTATARFSCASAVEGWSAPRIRCSLGRDSSSSSFASFARPVSR
jgi:hypothetical protein